jgi:hypothetical protein
LPRHLVISGGFTIDGGQQRHLDQQARRLGFADLRACLHALLDDGWSIPLLALGGSSVTAVTAKPQVNAMDEFSAPTGSLVFRTFLILFDDRLRHAGGRDVWLRSE